MTKPLDTTDAELLVALIINLCSHSPEPDDPLWFRLRPRVAAIRSGDHVVIERVTEAEAREQAGEQWTTHRNGERDDYVRAWLDAYRALGAIKGE